MREITLHCGHLFVWRARGMKTITLSRRMPHLFLAACGPGGRQINPTEEKVHLLTNTESATCTALSKASLFLQHFPPTHTSAHNNLAVCTTLGHKTSPQTAAYESPVEPDQVSHTRGGTLAGWSWKKKTSFEAVMCPLCGTCACPGKLL